MMATLVAAGAAAGVETAEWLILGGASNVFVFYFHTMNIYRGCRYRSRPDSVLRGTSLKNRYAILVVVITIIIIPRPGVVHLALAFFLSSIQGSAWPHSQLDKLDTPKHLPSCGS